MVTILDSEQNLDRALGIHRVDAAEVDFLRLAVDAQEGVVNADRSSLTSDVRGLLAFLTAPRTRSVMNHAALSPTLNMRRICHVLTQFLVGERVEPYDRSLLTGLSVILPTIMGNCPFWCPPFSWDVLWLTEWASGG
ncbi:MAG TPA: hypothetical protein VMU06_07970 [Stellaceae bacterium]|nr:hypothetical protein [Stellaceae bacterium]